LCIQILKTSWGYREDVSGLSKMIIVQRKIRRLNNYELYQDFYRMTDQLNCIFVKVRGHQVSNQKDEIDRLFTLVDRASRDALRGDNR